MDGAVTAIHHQVHRRRGGGPCLPRDAQAHGQGHRQTQGHPRRRPTPSTPAPDSRKPVQTPAAPSGSIPHHGRPLLSRVARDRVGRPNAGKHGAERSGRGAGAPARPLARRPAVDRGGDAATAVSGGVSGWPPHAAGPAWPRPEGGGGTSGRLTVARQRRCFTGLPPGVPQVAERRRPAPECRVVPKQVSVQSVPILAQEPLPDGPVSSVRLLERTPALCYGSAAA